MYKWLAVISVCLLMSTFGTSPSFGSPKSGSPPATKSVSMLTNTAPVSGSVRFQSSSSPFTETVSLVSEEQEFISRINTERSSRGLNTLVIDPVLVVAARGHSLEMSQLDYFDHHSPTTGIRTPMDRYLGELHQMGQSTPDYALCGENIFYCSVLNDTYNVSYGHTALMNSPGHRANILEPRFRKVGVGVYHDARGQFWVTEMFLRDTD
jgi:uncharacterized protein YkwD